MEAVIKAREVGFSKLVVLTNSRSTEKIWKGTGRANWREHVLLNDLKTLAQQRMMLTIKSTPTSILDTTYNNSIFTSKEPIHHFWVHPDLSNK